MRRVVPISLLTAVGLSVTAHAQAPAPPAPLPGSITRPVPPAVVVPVGATAPATRQPPIARFQNLQACPPETAQAVFGMRTGAEWLARMQQPHGRFLPGLNPAVNLPVEGEDDFRQAMATLAVCQSARFTGDEKLTAVAGQAVLSLLTLTKDDPTDPACRAPVTPPGCNKVGFATALALAIYELPSADARLFAEGEKLTVFVRKQIQADGSVRCAEGTAEAECTNLYPGLVLQALAAANRVKPDSEKALALTRGIAYYRAAFRAKPHPVLAGTVIPAADDLFAQTRDRDAAATAFEMADWLCASQYGRTDVRQVLWAGGFRTSGTAEPGYESAYAARGLAAAAHLTRQWPDLTRYAKYRPALVDAVGFVRGIQYTQDNTDHFEGKFRAHYLIGGVRLAPADGTLRVEATAAAVSAYLRYLESGAEGRD